jgi:hypothetical protein
VAQGLLDGHGLELGRRAAAERAARRRQDELVDRARLLGDDELVQGRVLGVDRQDLRARGLRQRGHQLAADDQRFLVGEREVDPLGERDDRRAEPGRADDRVEHEIGVRLGDELHQPLWAGQHLALRPDLGGARGRIAVRQRDPPHAVLARLPHEILVRGPRRQPDDLELVTHDVERLRAYGPGRTQDEKPLHRRPIVATVI